MAVAQSSVPQLLEQARAAASEARVTYEVHTPDGRLWREALELGEQARRLEPQNLDVLRFLALTYSEVNWHVRAHQLWNDYLEAGGNLKPLPGEGGLDPAQAYAKVGQALGFSRYLAGSLQAAADYYLSVLRQLPGDQESLYWLGRINLELGEEEAARRYFSELLERDPEHRTAGFYLSLIAERESVGEEASRAYREGLSAYEEGRLADAHEHFARALANNRDFADAAVWAGRTALELEQPTVAQGFWERVVQLRPGDAGARYFLEVAQAQARWGVEAGRAYFQGQAAYQRGDLSAAAAAFERAVAANPRMVDAWVWAARAHQERGSPAAAIQYWQGVLERQPEDERARYFLDVARRQLQYGAEAGAAFSEAVRHYQLAQFDEAEASFRRAVNENPGFASAWGWLGRLYFTRGQYSEAARAYSRAAELEPENEDYAFFAEEAALLAGEGQ